MKDGSVRLLTADAKGRIFASPRLAPAGMKAGVFFRLSPENLIRLPAGSQLFRLPERRPVGCDPETGSFVTTSDAFAVAAFAAPGYTLTHNAAYAEDPKAGPLPLFSYGACAEYKGEFYTAAVKVDTDRRHDSTLIDMGKVKKNIEKFKKIFGKNRLVRHLAGCAVVYGCPNAQNFFLRRYEAPLPVSPSCNAACAGCISYQSGAIHCSQPRIKFVPTPEEIAGIALFHIGHVKDPILSFGQGCEGEPLLQGKTIERAIRLIRMESGNGTININTNGSRPKTLERLFDAGLDAARISLNSAQERYYSAYYRPQNYSFKDVMDSVKTVKAKGGFVSLNYLTMPGFTDSRKEIGSLVSLIARLRIDMIQWRNLNYDPLLYFKKLRVPGRESADTAGIAEEMDRLKRRFPKLMMGYFNPSKEKFSLRAAASPRR
ncbi:MAG: radical SAM protein [Candidatus Omnitrophica bacterium]|nr:radical SAM protein [Candidatus Omnitrophota bacterium]MDD5436982.1 radical SAM protein [Candidatus Omnitrophota bacterium]